MNISIASLIGSILAVTVSVGFAVTFRISLNKKITEINKTVNDFKTEVNQRLTNIETKINMINEKKIENSGPGVTANGGIKDSFVCGNCHGGMYMPPFEG